MAIDRVQIFALIPELAELVTALDNVFDGEGNLRQDAQRAMGELYDVVAALSPKVADIPRQHFVRIVSGIFQVVEAAQGIAGAHKQ